MSRRSVSAYLTWGVCASLLVVEAAAHSAPGITAQNVTQTILGKSAATEDALRTMDSNWDGKVDVSDIFALSQSPTVPSLYGHMWQITVSYGNAAVALPLHYSFLLKIKPAPATSMVGGLLTTDPSKAATQQGTRLSYPLSVVLPEGTQFSLSESGTNVTLASPDVIISANTEFNPMVDRELRHTWRLTIDTSTLSSVAPSHGTIRETIVGLLPNGRPLELTGTIELADLGLF